MYVILFSEDFEDAPWRLVPDALYWTKDRAVYDAASFGLHNPHRKYQVFRLTPLKGQ